MSDMIASYLSNASSGLFVRQVLVILALFLFGFFVNAYLCKGKMSVLAVLLAYPVGVSIYSLISYILLVVGLPFNTLTITVVCLLIGAACAVDAACLAKRDGYILFTGKEAAKYLITALCIAVISSSGLLSVSVSNDSLYYYHFYPKALATYGFLRPQFDVFLTDIGQTSATMNTLPFMYGYDENFGTQTFLGLNTILIVFHAFYKKTSVKFDRKMAAFVTAVLSVILISTQPFIIMLKWAMSNGYFMCFMFITVFTVHECAGMTDDVKTSKGDLRGWVTITGILMLQMSLLRMEGIMVALILTVCFSMLDYKNAEIFKAFLLPEFICALLYAVRVFVICKVDAPYTFLTPAKAILQLAAIVIVSVYMLAIRGRSFDFAGKHLKIALPLALIGANGLLFIADRILYIENVLAFIRNISNRSGWGLFPMYIIACYVLVFIVSFKNGDSKLKMTFWDMCFVCYLLAALAVCFAREDALRESIGDSGNRVLMQVTLLAFYAGADHIIDIIHRRL